MNNYIKSILFIISLIINVVSYYSEGDNPLLPRQNAMANTGYSLSNDENVLYYNPAGLGLPIFQNLSLIYGSIINTNDDNSFKPIHKRGNIIYGLKNIGGFSFDISQYNYKEDDSKLTYLGIIDDDFIDIINDMDGKLVGVCDDNGVFYNPEYLISLGWGHNLSFIKLNNHSIGICFNLLSYASNINIFTSDIGYLYVSPFNLRAGIVFKNLFQIKGKNIKDFDISNVPRMINTAIGYCNLISIHEKINILSIAVEINGNVIFREERYYYFFVEHGNLIPYLGTNINTEVKQEVYGRLNIGLETLVLNSLSFRIGYVNGSQFKENEFHYGFGLRLFNHINIDYYKGEDPLFKEDIYQFTISINNLLKWDKNDLKWWLKRNN